jgi:signal transduction histidine kinase
MIHQVRNRFSAPIRYRDVRSAYNITRAIGGLAIVAGAMVQWAGGTSPAPWVALSGLAVAVDGFYRRHRGVSAVPLLLVDIVAVGTALLVRGHTPSIEAAALAYVVTAALLLLHRREAVLVIGFALAWALPIGVAAPLAGANVPEGTQAALAETLAVTVFVGVVAQLLIATGRALHAAAQAQREALDTERRAGELKNEFVSMVSHELRTPLTSIAGFADTLRESWESLSEAEIDEFLAIMRREAGHLRDLVEDILVIPRLEAGHLRLEPTELDLRSETFGVAEVVFQDGIKEFSVAIPGGVQAWADPVRLRQVMRNLLENARKYGGDQVLVEGTVQGDVYRVVVADNGPGVPEDQRDRIFEHFEQLTKGDARSDKGVGLGLPIARTLVRAMGGDLWYEPRFPIGAQFCFTLQLARMTTGVEERSGSDSPVAQ